MKFLKMIFFGSLVFLLTACSSKSNRAEKEAGDTSAQPSQDILTGSMDVVVDESILPLLKEQVDVFQSSYTHSKINLIAEPERLSINTLLKGNAGVAILKRELTPEESASFKQRSISPKVFPVAYDGIVLVTQRQFGDSTTTLSEIKGLLEGVTGTQKTLVFDNVNSSSLRFLKELVGVQRVVAKQVKTVENVDGVFEATQSDANSIGVLSLNQYLAGKNSFEAFDNIRILGVKNEEDGKFYKPSQSSLADGTYPLKQEIYVLNYQPNLGLGIGFSAFLTGDRGQRIVLKAGLLPATMPGRELIIRDEIKL